MSKKTKAATSAKETTPNNINNLPATYHTLSPEARGKSIARIADRRSDMPKIYRANYDRAMAGNSLRAAINAQCLECVQWQRVEVRLCPSTPCPLWSYRPYQLNDTDNANTDSNLPSDGPDLDSESPNTENGEVGP